MDGTTEMSDHLGGCYPEGDANTIMHDVWGWLLVEYDIKSMVDVGCGYGHALEWFSRHLVSSEGVDGFPPAVEQNVSGTPCYLHDFTQGQYAAATSKKWDLGWCAEFVEHIEEQFIPNYMHTLQSCKHACITHAEPGQIGFHHVNCQTRDYWVKVFQKYGFVYDEGNSHKLRTTNRWNAGWGRKSLLLFHNIKES
jgi:hypothetical protein